MSGVEVMSFIPNIIAIVNASLQLYEALDNAAGLPQSFRNVATRLPLVQEMLGAAQDGLATDGRDDANNSNNSDDALAKVLESCYDKVIALDKVLQAVMPAAGASRMKRYLKAVQTIPYADKVEKLMDGILGDLQVLTGNYAIKAASRAQIERLIAAARGRGEKPGYGGGGPAVAARLYSAGSGSQYVHTGHGNQNVASGKGSQINGQSTGPIYIGWTG